MTIAETLQGSSIQLDIAGRIDAVNAPELQNAILVAFQKGEQLIVNFAGVEYISSAGLRALLIGQKTAASKRGSMVLTNVSEEVMEILDVTGFAQILKIE